MAITRRNGPGNLDPHSNPGPRTFDPGIIDRAGTGRIDPSLGVGGWGTLATPIGRRAYDRLTTVRNDLADLTAAVRDAAERHGNAVQEYQAASRRLRDLQKNRLTAPHHAEEARNRRDQLKFVADDTKQRVDDLQARQATPARIIQNAERWIAENQRGGITEAQAPDLKLPKGVSAAAYVDQLRQRRLDLGAELHRIRSQPHSSKSVKEDFRRLVEATGNRAADVALRAVETRRVALPEHHTTSDVTGFVIGEGTPVIGRADVRLPDLAAIIFASPLGQTIAEWFEAEVDRLVDDENALDDDVRADMVAANLAAQLDCERREAEVIFRSAEQGTTIAHRPSIDPRAFLGLDGPPLRD